MKPQLKIQEYLRSGKSLDTLKAELGIEYNEHGQLIILNYSQIDSPKNHPIVLECRGLILEKDSWDVICYPLKRFFNYGEVLDATGSFDFYKAVGLEKLDGTLISLFNYKDQWMMATRGVIENTSHVGIAEITFKELFNKTTERYPYFWKNLDKKYTYSFELTALENRVVTIYHERKLHLILMREVETLKELNLKDLKSWADKLGVSFPKKVTFQSGDELLELAKKLATLEEGFVAVIDASYDEDGISFKRVKVKNPAYVAIHHLKDRSGRSLRSFISLIRGEGPNEFLSYFPEFTSHVEKVTEAYNRYIEDANTDVERLKDYLNILDADQRKAKKKEFAFLALKCLNSDFMFNMYNGRVKDIQDYFNKIEKEKGSAFLEKSLVDKLKLKDIKLFIE
jgi:T4 RnlA family RNA ligase